MNRLLAAALAFAQKDSEAAETHFAAALKSEPNNPQLALNLATIRLTYPRIAAVAGPCGVWPEDLGPSINNKGYLDNKPYFNLGCANQRNLAAMVANPSDLVQPRPETGAYTARRAYGLEKYRQDQSTATIYPDADKNKISNVGQ